MRVLQMADLRRSQENAAHGRNHRPPDPVLDPAGIELPDPWRYVVEPGRVDAWRTGLGWNRDG
jgi:hypothetical protein